MLCPANCGVDNNCDGLVECDNPDCALDPVCATVMTPVCEDGTCDTSEDCNACPTDCPSRMFGRASRRYCCGNSAVKAAEGDGAICDGNF